MAPRRDRGRLGAVSATLSAGTLMFFAVGTTPASAETRSAAASGCLPLLKPVCDILGVGGSTPSSPPPKSSGGGGSGTKPSSAPKPKPKPAPAGKASAHHAPRGGSAGGAGAARPAPPAGDAPTIPVPQTAQGPALPDVAGQDPLVVPEAGPGTDAPSARLVADSSSDHETIPPLLVATASGLIGAIAALNLSVLRGRRRD